MTYLYKSNKYIHWDNLESVITIYMAGSAVSMQLDMNSSFLSLRLTVAHLYTAPKLCFLLIIAQSRITHISNYVAFGLPLFEQVCLSPFVLHANVKQIFAEKLELNRSYLVLDHYKLQFLSC